MANMTGLRKTVLFKLLSKLSKKELIGLQSYGVFSKVSSPTLKAIRLFSSSNWEQYSNEDFFRACHGLEVPFSTNRFQMFFTSIREFVFEYLAVLNVRRSAVNKYDEAIKLARERSWDTEIMPLYRRLHRQMVKVPEGLEHYFLRHQLQVVMHETQIRSGQLNQGQAVMGDWRLFEELFLVQSLRFKCIALDLRLSGKAVNPEEVAPDAYMEVLFEKSSSENRPLISAYGAIWRMLTAPYELVRLFHARKLISKHIANDSIQEEHIGDLLRLLMNHATRLVTARKLRRRYLIELSSIEVQYITGNIHPRELKNIIALLTSVGKIEEAESMLERFQGSIDADPEGHALEYNRGVILFAKEEYRLAIPIFQSLIHSLQDTYLKSDGRMYLWRSRIAACIEGQEFDPDFFDREKEKSRQFFRRTTALKDSSKEFYLDYLRVFHRFYSALGQPRSKRRQKLQGLLEQVRHFSEHPLKKWLVQKLEMALHLR